MFACVCVCLCVRVCMHAWMGLFVYASLHRCLCVNVSDCCACGLQVCGLCVLCMGVTA